MVRVDRAAPVDDEPVCAHCGAVLTLEEERYYEYRCEKCERAWHERIQAWKAGADDPKLDKLYGELAAPPKRVLN